MKWIKDKTGRFPERLYFEHGEIDSECESIIRNFFSKELRKPFCPPFTIEQLEVLINTEVEVLDLYADLSEEGEDVEGLTEFTPNKKPSIKISSLLSSAEIYKNRLKSTMAHELFHAKFHNLLWALKWSQDDFFGSSVNKIKCHRKHILGAGQTDWIEWQAAYGSGAFTMPKSFLLEAVKDFKKLKGVSVSAPIDYHGEIGIEIIKHISNVFEVSEEAAKVRLFQMGFVHEVPAKNLMLSY